MFWVIIVAQGLKTGMYYLRTKPAAQAIQFTVDKTKLKTKAPGEGQKQEDTDRQKEMEDNMAAMVCSLDNKEACVMCSG